MWKSRLVWCVRMSCAVSRSGEPQRGSLCEEIQYFCLSLSASPGCRFASIHDWQRNRLLKWMKSVVIMTAGEWLIKCLGNAVSHRTNCRLIDWRYWRAPVNWQAAIGVKWRGWSDFLFTITHFIVAGWSQGCHLMKSSLSCANSLSICNQNEIQYFHETLELPSKL